MPQFHYRALNSQGQELEGDITARDANEAVVNLSRQGLRLKSINEGARVLNPPPPRTHAPAAQNPVAPPVYRQTGQSPTTPATSHEKPSPRATYNDRQFFFAQLGGLSRSGISPADALHTILARSSQEKFRRQFDDMARMCSNGQSLSDAMEHYPNMFPKGVIGAVRAGETGGYLPEACETLSIQQKETRRVFNMFATLLIALPWAIVLMFMSTTIAVGISDAFGPLIEGSGNSSGSFGRGISNALGPILVVFALLVAGSLVAYFGGRSHKFRKRRHEIGLKLPMFKRRALNENLSHFSFHLGRLAKSGLSPFASWQLAAHAVPNEAYSAQLISMSSALGEQTRLSELLYRSKLFPRETAQLVETGEMTGDLPLALDQVMDFGREREKEANKYIGMKAGCWTLIVFFIGGMLVLMIIYVAYIKGLDGMMDGMEGM